MVCGPCVHPAKPSHAKQCGPACSLVHDPPCPRAASSHTICVLCAANSSQATGDFSIISETSAINIVMFQNKTTTKQQFSLNRGKLRDFEGVLHDGRGGLGSTNIPERVNFLIKHKWLMQTGYSKYKEELLYRVSCLCSCLLLEDGQFHLCHF